MLAPDFRFAGGRRGRLDRAGWIAAALAVDRHSLELAFLMDDIHLDWITWRSGLGRTG